MLSRGLRWVMGLAAVSSIVVFISSPRVRADIEITEEDWENFIEMGTEPGQGDPATPPPSIVETDDGRLSLYFSGAPDDNLAYVNYVLDVTELPGGGDGPERFHVFELPR